MATNQLPYKTIYFFLTYSWGAQSERTELQVCENVLIPKFLRGNCGPSRAHTQIPNLEGFVQPPESPNKQNYYILSYISLKQRYKIPKQWKRKPFLLAASSPIERGKSQRACKS